MKLDSGELSVEQLNAMLLALPLEITFTDENDIIRYFTGREDSIFTREESDLGTDVRNCHPPHSMDSVEKILGDMKSGKKNQFEAYYESKDDKFVYTLYTAVRDKSGKFLGCLETVQDVAHIRSVTGTKTSID